MKKQGLVLDLGCGPGKASALMQKSGLRVDPIDASKEMVKLANNLYDLKARQAEFSDINGEDIMMGFGQISVSCMPQKTNLNLMLRHFTRF